MFFSRTYQDLYGRSSDSALHRPTVLLDSGRGLGPDLESTLLCIKLDSNRKVGNFARPAHLGRGRGSQGQAPDGHVFDRVGVPRGSRGRVGQMCPTRSTMTGPLTRACQSCCKHFALISRKVPPSPRCLCGRSLAARSWLRPNRSRSCTMCGVWC